MARRPTTGLTPLELDIMKVLWKEGAAPVQTVMERLLPRRPLAYNSVQTMLNVLLRKRKVVRRRRDRAYEYAPALTRARAIREAVGDLVHRMFEGSPEDLVMSLIETRQLTPARIERLVALVGPRRGGSRGKP
jgi:BlaI family transcriptional regulator, penicillinase repressor